LVVPLEPVAQWAAMVQSKRLFASGEVLISTFVSGMTRI